MRNYYLPLGSLFIIVGGLIYSSERITAKICAAIIASAYANKGMASDATPSYPNVFDNIFVMIFSFVGILIVLYSLLKKD